MDSDRSMRRRMLRGVLTGVLLLLILSACRSLPGQSFLDELLPEPTATTVCQSSAALQAAVADLRSTDLSQDGLIVLAIRIDAAISEARLLVELVSEELRPTVEAMVLSLQGLRASVEELSEQETLGAGIAAIGESITQVGDDMDALARQLRERCP